MLLRVELHRAGVPNRSLPPNLPHKPSSGSLRKIPIGVFDPVYEKLSLDEMVDRVSALGLEAMEIGTGGYPGTGHCPIDELLADAGKQKHGKRNLKIVAFTWRR